MFSMQDVIFDVTFPYYYGTACIESIDCFTCGMFDANCTDEGFNAPHQAEVTLKR